MAGLVGVMALVVGCGGATKSAPAAEPTSSVVATPVEDEPWDPCTIPNDAIEAAGLDVNSKSTNLFGDAPLSTDWMICAWRNPDPGSWYFLGVFSSDHDLAYLKGNDQFGEFTVVNGTGAVQFRRTANYDEVSCGVAYEVVGGIVYFILDGRASREPLGDPCVEVERVGSALRPLLPPSNR
ncbi:DUF3558 domain-containing protein [Rhodococcus sp. 05-339-2]|uniref:DUF3558 domain-containing protein n=1 Tax=Rhodococcoides fascians TaxID=1828 RepID=UPI0009E8A7D7|nr:MULTISPECIES: DUF3558 domain-containing protein [Rhodococcus]OZD83865.1 DUF3558 domain-containing protein [Rhodococcus sp. 05-339-2]